MSATTTEQNTGHKKLTLTAFLKEFANPLAEKARQYYKPLHNPFIREGIDFKLMEKLSRLRRQLLPAQREAALAAWKYMTRTGSTVCDIAGEMGVGKTITGIAIAYLLNPSRVIVMCPPHLVRKWEREIKITYPGNVNTFRLNNRHSLRTLIDLYNRRGIRPDVPEFYIIGRERAKLGEPWRNVYITSKHRSYMMCPDCYAPIDWDEWSEKKRYTCPECNNPTYQYYKRYNRWPLSDFIKRKLKGVFDFAIFDEVHELKGGETAQGNSFGAIASAAKKSLCLTGTYNGGYPQDIFYILYRTRPWQFRDDKISYTDVDKFIDLYGARETRMKKDDDATYYDHSVSRGSQKRRVQKVLPIISPALIGRHVIDRAIFLKLADISGELPDYNEELINLEMDPALKEEYKALEATLRDIYTHDAKRSLGFYSVMAQALLQYPDAAYEERWVRWKEVTPEGIVERELPTVPVYNTDTFSAKEKQLVDLVKRHRKAGEKVLVYLEYTGTKDISPRITHVLKRHGISSVVLTSSVQADRREKWIEDHTKEVDVLITNPEIVKTGLDLFDFPAIVFYQVGYKVYTMRQAARRSWRIGQKKPVNIYYLSYRGTAQELARVLVGKKLFTALMLEGEITESSLVQESEGDSILKELADAIVGNKKLEDAESIWKQLRKQELESELHLADGAPSHEVVSVSKEEEVTQIGEKVIFITDKKGRKKRTVRIEVRADELESELIRRGIEGPVQFGLF